MIKRILSSENLSITVNNDDIKLGEIIHWQKTGILEVWHYKTLFLGTPLVDIAFFDENNIKDAILFAKIGEKPENALEYKTNKEFKK